METIENKLNKIKKKAKKKDEMSFCEKQKKTTRSGDDSTEERKISN